MYTIATLHDLRVHLGIDPGVDDARLLAALEAATAQIERLAGRRFLPHVEARAQDVDPYMPGLLLLDDDLTALDSLTDGDGSPISPADVRLIPANGGPVSAIMLANGWAFTWIDSPQQAATVSGTWGWHDRPARAWRDSADTVQDNPLSASAPILIVTDADGVDSEGVSPRFRVGGLLRIEDEYLWVLAVDTVSNTLTVGRGANGTTAASHAQGATIELYLPPADMRALALRWAGWIYRTPDHDPAESVPDGLLAEIPALRRLRLRA